VPAFAKDGSVTRDLLYFHHEGHRAIRIGDWKLVSLKPAGSDWELYDMSVDRCEEVNLASQCPDRLRDMSARWKELEDQFREQAGPAPAGKREQAR
jgi:arylsulfatase